MEISSGNCIRRLDIIISHRKDNIEMYDKVINVSGNEGKEVAHE